MHILVLNCDLPSLPGHTIYQIKAPQGGIVSIRRLLKHQTNLPADFPIDLFLQKETLGTRLFVRDLAYLPCPKIFWSIDSHLNLFWQHWYCQLFDLVLTPHPALFRKLPSCWTPKTVYGFTNPGYERGFRPHTERPKAAVFVGVIDKHREQRRRFAQFLQSRHGVQAQQVPFTQMLELYTNSRLLPNESICHEFNFRIMEGASCGCCVLTEDIGDDLAANFAIGKEVLTYRHALELTELMNFLQSRPTLSEKIGLAAWQRVQKEHLPRHRWQTLEHLSRHLTARRRDHQECERLALLSAVQACRGDGTDNATLAKLTNLLKTLAPHPDVLAMRLRLAAETQDTDQLQDLLSQLTQKPLSLDLAVAAYGASVRLNDQALLTQTQTLLLPYLAPHKDLTEQPLPLALADLLIREQRICQPGFRFDPRRHCPETALELLLMLETCMDLPKPLIHKKLAELAGAIPFISLNKSHCQRWAEEDPRSWQAAFDAGLCCLKAFYPEEGHSYLQRAQKLAAAQAEEQAFVQALNRAGLSRT